MSTTTLLTGFPATFLAVRVLEKLLADDPQAHVTCLVRTQFRGRADEIIGALPARDRERVTLLDGDVASMDLGLSGKEFVQLARDVRVVHHCAAASYLGVSREMATNVNVDGTREVLELVSEAKDLERLVHWSSALTCGGRRGYVLEDELAAPAGFRNVVEETRFEAERLVRRAIERRSLRATILRPSIVVGDSATGQIDRFEGPYLLVLLLLNSPPELRIPLPGRADVPLPLVPVDYVVDAGLAIARDPRSVGRCFHLVDPAPSSARRVFERLAQAAGRPIPRGSLPTTLATALMRAPGFDRFAHVQRGFLEQLATEVVFDDRGARELLAPTGIRCPSVESYVDVMVQYVREQLDERRARRPDTDAAFELDETTTDQLG